jgi:hypothetical protein
MPFRTSQASQCSRKQAPENRLFPSCDLIGPHLRLKSLWSFVGCETGFNFQQSYPCWVKSNLPSPKRRNGGIKKGKICAFAWAGNVYHCSVKCGFSGVQDPTAPLSLRERENHLATLVPTIAPSRNHDGRRCSLSHRERAGVRGKGASKTWGCKKMRCVHQGSRESYCKLSMILSPSTVNNT